MRMDLAIALAHGFQGYVSFYLHETLHLHLCNIVTLGYPETAKLLHLLDRHTAGFTACQMAWPA